MIYCKDADSVKIFKSLKKLKKHYGLQGKSKIVVNEGLALLSFYHVCNPEYAKHLTNKDGLNRAIDHCVESKDGQLWAAMANTHPE